MRNFLPILSLALVFSCSSSTSEKTSQDSTATVVTKAPILKKGEVNESYVASDPSNTFSVYLPTNYDSAKKYPVIIFFDAHADGHLPLNNYKSIAEKWGYIFVGSNTSKNGLAVEITTRIGNELVDEVKKNLNVNLQEIILCGFSGGSRVASNIAMTRNDIKGIICNSAAPQFPMTGKVFVGLAGLGDMNYLEMKKFEENQTGNTSPHELLVFDGKHEWTPANMMEDAMLIISLNHSTVGGNVNDATMAKALAENIFHQADSISKTSYMISQNLLASGHRACHAYDACGKIDNAIASKNNSALKSDEAAWKAAEDQESQLQQELEKAMMEKDTTWWKSNESNYFETTKKGAEKFMRERLRGYASLMCYSYANQAFKSNNLHAAQKLIAIYSIVDPTNCEWAYMFGELYSEIGMPDAAISSLEKAIELGFNDQARMQNDPAFSSLQSDARFGALYGKMK